jgi:hypothetical protein
VAVAAVVTWWSCFFVTSRPWYRMPALGYGIHPGNRPTWLSGYWCIRSHILSA